MAKAAEMAEAAATACATAAAAPASETAAPSARAATPKPAREARPQGAGTRPRPAAWFARIDSIHEYYIDLDLARLIDCHHHNAKILYNK